MRRPAFSGVRWLIRPLRPEDEPLMRRFHENLSDVSVYFRYLHPYKLSARTSHERLTRVCSGEGGRDVVLAATAPAGAEEAILAIGRLSPLDGDASGAELAVVVADPWQRKGLGTAMTHRLVQEARERGFARVVAHIHRDNDAMRKLCAASGFRESGRFVDRSTVLAEIRT